MDANVRRIVNEATSLLVRESFAVSATRGVTEGEEGKSSPMSPQTSPARSRQHNNPSHLGNNVDETV